MAKAALPKQADLVVVVLYREKNSVFSVFLFPLPTGKYDIDNIFTAVVYTVEEAPMKVLCAR